MDKRKLDFFRGIFNKNTLALILAGSLEEGGIDSESGPAGFILIDPDGNPILIELHV